MTEQHFTEQTKALIDSLKTICANYGLGNNGNKFKIISQAFLYKERARPAMARRTAKG